MSSMRAPSRLIEPVTPGATIFRRGTSFGTTFRPTASGTAGCPDLPASGLAAGAKTPPEVSCGVGCGSCGRTSS